MHADSSSPGFNWLPCMLLLFVGSGCSALIYEIVWFQMLQLVIGSTTISLGILLATFMGGMCLGSLGFASWVATDRHPIRVYAVLEFGIGLLGLLLLGALPMVGRVYSSLSTGPTTDLVLRATLCSLLLLPPTMLMGATLPAVSRWWLATSTGVTRMGLFYAANIVGAVSGCLGAGFYLLRVYDAQTATLVAFAINLIVGLVAWGIASRTTATQGQPTSKPDELPEAGVIETPRWAIHLAIGLSGLSALGCEVVWTRLLSLMLGATVYTFSIILAVFLIGLGIGSGIGSVLAHQRERAALRLGVCQILAMLGVTWSAWTLLNSLPYWPINVGLKTSVWHVFQLDILRCGWAIGPATLAWGASFPLAIAAASRPGDDPGRFVGRVSAANTIGAIAGSLVFGMLVIPALGTRMAHQLIILAASLAAAVAILPGLVAQISPRVWLAFAGLVLLTIGVTTGNSLLLPEVPPALVGYGRHLPLQSELPRFIHVREGINASVAVSDMSDGSRNFHVSGKVVASSSPQDMRLQRLLGHLPALLHPNPKSVLIVGCGAGVTAGTFVTHPSVKRIVICEIEPEIPPAAGKYFSRENHAVIDDPRVEVVLDDARHFVLTTDETFDIITSDPIHPWVKGAAALYSQEYFELCRSKLNRDGIVTQWVPLYESNSQAVGSQIATFLEVFPDGSIWSNDVNGVGYDIVLLGREQPSPINLMELERRLSSPESTVLRRSLSEVSLGTLQELLSTYTAAGPDLQEWRRPMQLNRDSNLRLQYLAGLGINTALRDEIHLSLLQHRRYPDGVFEAPPELERQLRRLLQPVR